MLQLIRLILLLLLAFKTSEIVKVFDSLETNIKEENIKTKHISSKGQLKSFLVTLKDVNTKTIIMRNRRAKGIINSENMRLEGPARNIYINDDLPKPVQQLFRKTRQLKKAGYRYVWTREGTVMCRRDDSSKVIIIAIDIGRRGRSIKCYFRRGDEAFAGSCCPLNSIG